MAFSASAAYFLENYRTVTKKASEAVREYLGDPSADHAHALRTSARRIDASFRLLPKKARKDRLIREYEERCRKVLKLTSPIRDLDMVTERLKPHKGVHALSLLARRMANRRQKLVKDSMKASWKLFEMAVPKLEHGDLSGIDAKIEDVLGELDGKIARLLPDVMTGESKLEQLHILRKRSKRLRYMLEAVPPTPTHTRAAEVLRAWQDTLGAIHDSDVMIDCLRREAPHSESVRKMLKAERARRHSQYLRFRRSYGKTFGRGNRPRNGDSVFFRRKPRIASDSAATAPHHQ